MLCVCVLIFFKTLREAKQFIKNGLVMINDQIIKSANYILKDKDIMTIRPDLRLQYKKKYYNELMSGQILRGLPPYLCMNLASFKIIFLKDKFTLANIPYFSNFPWTRFPNIRKNP